MIKVVADTNIYISALNFGGVADELLSLARKNNIDLFASPPILDEIKGVLIDKFNWSTKRARESITTIKSFTKPAHPQETINLITEDEPDNRILECATEAKAHFIVTGDKLLQNLRSFRGIRIISLREFLDSKVWLA